MLELSPSPFIKLDPTHYRAACLVGDSLTFEPGNDIPVTTTTTNDTKPNGASAISFSTHGQGTTGSAQDTAGVYTYTVTPNIGQAVKVTAIVFPVAALTHPALANDRQGVARSQQDVMAILRKIVPLVDTTAAATLLTQTAWWAGNLLVGGSSGEGVNFAPYGGL